ncbi:GAF domain-containing protein [Ilumatobacter fluminis]|uniref:histidine kinase n=1 Tax=Ilumatobacter fluminis TaxID=467091 RepID=A0A4R7HYZ4_9ACTN|nr:histidine kinase dimerization/phospho-acceptor domain-containing protein [Ilumatobacter fluminis]TDT16020.1 GAF domain-containing protein [Ilumatobacter fluminis]
MPPAHELAAELAIRLAGASREEVQHAVEEALQLLAREAGAPRAYITLYHDDGTFENSHEWTEGDVVPQRPVIQRLRSSDFEYSYQMAMRNEVLAATDLDQLPVAASAEKASFSSFGVRAVLQVPMIVNDECIGLIGFNYWSPSDPWSDDLVLTVRLIAQVIGVVLVRNRAESSMRRAYEEADRANRAKDEMLAHLSHELRTPLHAILGYTELMELDERSDHDREALFQIQFQGRNLLTMVDDLLSLANGDFVPDEAVELGLVVGETVCNLTPVSEQRLVELTLGDRNDEVTVHAEIARVRQVMYCVLSGVITAATPGDRIGVELAPDGVVHVRVRADDATARSVAVMPMARALIAGHGSIEASHRDDDDLDIAIRFDDHTLPARGDDAIVVSGASKA